MSPEERDPPRIRRMLPSVSEVLKELTARAQVEPDVAFRAAREVCAEELKRIRDGGGDSVPLEELVRRASLRVTGARPPAAPAPPAAPPVQAPAPLLEDEVFTEGPAPPRLDPGVGALDEPFSETTGAMDLRWDPDPHEPFAVPGPPPVDTATVPEPPAVPHGSPGLRAAPAAKPPVPFALPAEEDLFAEAVPDAEASAVALPTEPDPEKGPGDETLTRLSREARSIDLQAAFPRSSSAVSARPTDVPGLAAGAAPGAPPVLPPFEDDEDTVLTIPSGGGRGAGGRGPRIGLLLGVAASLAALAGLGYLLVGLWVEREEAPVPVAVARPRPQATPAPVATPAIPPSQEAVERSAPASADLAAPVDPPSPAATASPVPDPVPATPTAAPPEPVVLKAAAGGAAPAAAAPRTRDGLVVTRDREGQPPIFSIHFTSYRDRASAEGDLKRIERLVGREGFVAEVDLGEKGIWHRVMIGAFPTAPEARAAREELAGKGTRDMGWVYRVVGPEAPDPQ